MKNRIIIFGITTIVLVSLMTVSFPTTSKAAELTPTQTSWFISLLKSFGINQTKINDVEKILSTETQTIAQPIQQSTNNRDFCYNWTKTLNIGSKGDDVVALSTALQKEGFTGGMDEKGVYGETMFSAVQDFQLKYNIPHIGVVGPMTRAKLNSLYRCNVVTPTTTTTVPSSTQPSLIITSVKYSPAFPKINEFITTTVKVKNNSSVDQTTPFRINVQGTTATINYLAAHNETTVSVPNAFSFSVPGTHTLNTAIIDSSNNSGDVFTNTLTFTKPTTPSVNPVSYPVVTYPTNSSQLGTVSVITGPIVNSTTGNSYYLLSPANWSDSEAKAISLGGHLVAIGNADENKWVTDNFANYGGTSRHLWIGLSDSQTENTWKWTNNESVGYLNWASGEPNSGAGIYPEEDAVHIWDPSWGHGVGTWNDAQASLLYNGVVEVGGTSNVIPITEPNPVPAPTITSISIGGGDSCIQNTSMCRMEIVGTGFTATGNTVKVGDMSVGINNVNQGNMSAYSNKIIVDVPTNINPGIYNVVVSNVNGVSNAKVLTMKSNSTQPYVTSVSPSSAPMGSTITIKGGNFSKTSTNYIQLAGIPNSTIMLSGLSTDGVNLTVTLPNYNIAAGTVLKIWVDNDEFGASDENRSYLYNPVTFTVMAPVMATPAVNQ